MAGMMTDMLDTMIATADSTPPKRAEGQGHERRGENRITENGFPDAWIDQHHDGMYQRCHRGRNGHGEDGKQTETQGLDVDAPSDLNSFMRDSIYRRGERGHTIKGAATNVISETSVAENRVDE